MTQRFRRVRFIILAIFFVVLLTFSRGMKIVNAYSRTYTMTFHSHYPKSWNKEEETFTVTTDENGNFIFPDCPFEGQNYRRFVGWSYDPSENDNAYDFPGQSCTLYSNRHFYAVWVNEPIITYNSNFPAELGLENRKSCGYGKNYINNMFYFERGLEGYICNKVIDSDGNEYLVGDECDFYEDIELTYIWEKRDYVLLRDPYYTFYNNGNDEVIYARDDGYIYLPAHDSEDNKIVKCWKDSNGNEYKSLIRCHINSGTVLEPVYEDFISSKVRLHYDYPEIYDLESEIIEIDNDINGVSLSQGGDLPNGRNVIGYTDKDNNFYGMTDWFYCNEDIDLYAVWNSEKDYTVSFHSNYPEEWHLEEEVINKPIDTSGQISEKDYPNDIFEDNSSHTFCCWAYKNGEKHETWDILDKDTDLYAVWGKEWNITLLSNYPKEIKEINDQTINTTSTDWGYAQMYNSVELLDDYSYVKECGYYLYGWELPSGRIIGADGSFLITSDVEVKAVWKKAGIYNITFHSNYPSYWGVENKETTLKLSNEDKFINYMDIFDSYGGVYPVKLCTKNTDGTFSEILEDHPDCDMDVYYIWGTDIHEQVFSINADFRYPECFNMPYNHKILFYDEYGLTLADIYVPDKNYGYSIAGWEDKDGNLITTEKIKFSDGITEIYAIWNEPYEVTFKMPDGYYPEKGYIKTKEISDEYTLNVAKGDSIRTAMSKDNNINGTNVCGMLYYNNQSSSGWKTQDTNEYTHSEMLDFIPNGNVVFTPIWKNSDEHHWEVVEETEPTCSIKGKIVYACTDPDCDATYERYTDTIPHTWVYVDEVAPTCKDLGYEKGIRCEKCNKVHVGCKVIAMIPHEEEIIPGVAATCTEKGSTEGKKCTVCGKVTVTPVEIKELGHAFEDIPGTEIVSTCTEGGRSPDLKCSRCGFEEEGHNTNPLGHNYTNVPGTDIEVTCLTDGREADQICSRCKDVKEGGVIEATGHKEEIIPEVAATCTEKGNTAGKKCSVCGEILEKPEDIKALGHDYIDVEGTAKAATCTDDGKEADQKCSRCNDEIIGKVISAPGHKWDEWKITKEPTETEKGVKSHTCSVCGETKTEDIPVKQKSDLTPTPTVSPSTNPSATSTPVISPSAKPTSVPAVSPTEAPSSIKKNNITTFSIKNKAKIKKTSKIKVDDKDKIKKITLNGKSVKIKKNKTSITIKLKSYKKVLKKKGKWNTLKVTDNKGNVKTIKFKTK